MKHLLFGAAWSLFACVAFASTSSPYAGQEQRDIKSLSQHEIIGHLNGKGLGYAKAAELNQFPGPKHVLDLAEELNLTEQQIEATKAAFDAMKTEATRLGELYIMKEQVLEQAFSSNTIDPRRLEALTSEIGSLKAQIRYAHLNAHLKQKALLTQRQVHLYDQLRGYGTNQHIHHHSH